MVPYKPLPHAPHFDTCIVDNTTKATSRNTNVSEQQSANAYSAPHLCVQLPVFIFAILILPFLFPPLDIFPLFFMVSKLISAF